MQRNRHLFHQHVLMTSLWAISGVCGACSSPVELAAAGEEAPAHLIELSGTTAGHLAAYGYAEPVLVAYTTQGWAAVVFSEDPDAIPGLLDKLLVEDVPGCVPEGAVICCDESTGTFVLNTERGWLRHGERCEDPTDEGTGADVVRLPSSLTQELFACCGIVDEYIDLAFPDGTARLLWNWPPVTPSEGGELSPPPTMQRSAARSASTLSLVVTEATCSPIILAHGHPPPSPACVNNSPSSCCTPKRSKRCHSSRRHWYVKSETTGQWCERSGCQCC